MTKDETDYALSKLINNYTKRLDNVNEAIKRPGISNDYSLEVEYELIEEFIGDLTDLQESIKHEDL